MEIIKMHGLGNDFICLDHFLFPPDMDYPEMARKLCLRQLGVGADGLITILSSERADARMRIFNSDGSEAEMCGNGIRCFAKFVYDVGYVRKESMKIETLAGVLSVTLEIVDKQVNQITVDMGEPCLDPDKIPVLVEGDMAVQEKMEVDGNKFNFTAVSMGNPHCVIFIKAFDSLQWQTLGAQIEKNRLFPKKTNVEFVRVDNSHEITMKVWERGTGVTLACGTGACAAVVAGVLEGRINRQATVHLPGGDLQIEWREDNRVYMSGPAAYVFRAQLLF